MKKMILSAFMFLAAALVGCSPVSLVEVPVDATREVVHGQNADHGLLNNKQERHARMSLINDIQARQLQDDWDYIWLYDRSSHLSRWHARAGR